MKKLLFLLIACHIAICSQAQVLSIKFNQNGIILYGEAYVESNSYTLQSPNGAVCGFAATFEIVGDNTIKMYAYNPTLYGYVPATYFLYENGSCEVYVQGYVFNGSWNVKGGNVSFKGKCCDGSVGCSCTGFQPIKDGEVWEEEYCRKCGHHRRNHRK